jgi:tetratricopeptide (TPR) repeat protein
MPQPSANLSARSLDEIEALPLSLQSKFLKAIGEKWVRRIGTVRGHPMDVKIIAATTADLGKHVAQGRFRAALYHRQAVVVLMLPPLRACAEDILVLAEYLLLRYAKAHGDDLRTGRLGSSYVTHLRQLSAVYLLDGRVDEAWQHACQAFDRARQLQACGEVALALFQLGAVHAHASAPDVAQAEARSQEALTRAEALGMRPLQAHCPRGLGTLYAKIGQPEQACAELTAAIDLYRATDITFWLPQTEAALAQIGE